MIWRHHDSTELLYEMNVDKRPRPTTEPTDENVQIIVISDDEEPPKKKQKSLPPIRGSNNKAVKSATLQTTANSPLTQNNQSFRSQHGSTTSNPEAGGHRSVTSSNSKIQQLNTTPNGPILSFDWTLSDDTRLRELSISQDRQPGPDLYSPTVQDESEQLVNQFKIGPVTPLRFNPDSRVLLSKFAAQAVHVGRSESSHPDDVSSPAVNSMLPPQAKASPSAAQLVPSSKPSSDVLVKVPSRPTPSSSLPKFSIDVPLSDRARLRKERKELQEKLKQGVEYAIQHPAEVDRILGLTGFSSEFPANLDEEKFKTAAQPKKRVVNRTRIPLELLRSEPRSTPIEVQAGVSVVHPKDQAKSILTSRFKERFNPPLTFSNSLNDRRLNGKFQFVAEYILRKGVKVTGQLGQPGCSCEGRCNDHCKCLEKRFKDSENPKKTRCELVPQYERRSDGLIILRHDFIQRYEIHNDTKAEKAKERVEITECSERCSCDESCMNRVVQKGRTVPLEIFETVRCGFGVRSSQNLVRGQFIELYLGEVITDAELTRREEAVDEGSTSYVYSLDWFLQQQSYHIDGENFGSAMRFVNHSCDPNAATFTVLNNKSTRQLHHVAFFAVKDIAAGTEITIDYTPQAAGTTYELNTVDGMERCHCGAANCRRMLWRPGKERKARKKWVGKNTD